MSEYQERLEGAWVVYFYDNQLIVSKLWAREVEALRQAVEERSDGVIFVRWGQSVTEAVVEKDRIDRENFSANRVPVHPHVFGDTGYCLQPGCALYDARYDPAVGVHHLEH